MRHAMNPLVYKDFVVNVAFLGAPSTGKTTLAESLSKMYGTVWMPEYGREYWPGDYGWWSWWPVYVREWKRNGGLSRTVVAAIGF